MKTKRRKINTKKSHFDLFDGCAAKGAAHDVIIFGRPNYQPNAQVDNMQMAIWPRVQNRLRFGQRRNQAKLQWFGSDNRSR